MCFLKNITFDWNNQCVEDIHPFNIKALKDINMLNTDSAVTFFVGENGTGKSTFIENIAYKCGFNVAGGSANNRFGTSNDGLELASIMKLSWFPKVKQGFFLRAETFFDFAGYIDDLANDPNVGMEAYLPYGGKSLNHQSHGEAFLSLFTNRFSGRGIYILDEPEAALSPQRQLAFLRVIHDLELEGNSQFIIATHSPILMSYPGARIYSFDHDTVEETQYEETAHYQLTKSFLNNRERFLKQLFEE